MKTIGGFLAVLSISWCAGCGGGDAIGPGTGTGGTTVGPKNYADALQGNWSSMISSTCIAAVNFIGAAASLNFVCLGADRTAELQSSQGTFTADATQIKFVFDQSTCSDADKRIYFPYSFAGESLQLSDDTGVVLFVRNTSDGGSGGAAKYGCFRDGVFTASPLAPI